MLSDARRSQLDGLVDKMSRNNEKDSDIQFVINDFKSKYGDEGEPASPQPGHGMGDLKMAEAAPAPEPLNPIFPSAEAEYNTRMTKPSGSAWQSIKDMGAISKAAFDDAMSAAQRGAAAAFTDQTMNTPGAHALKKQTDQAVANSQADLAAHPELNNYIPPGGAFGMPMMMAIPSMAPALTEMGGRIADDPMSYAPAVAGAVGKIPGVLTSAGKVVGFANKQAGKLASELSGVPEEALRAYGDPAMRAKMAENFGKKSEIGADLLNHIDHPDNYLPEKDVVNKSLQNMGPISLESVIDDLNNSKVSPTGGRLLPGEKTANKKIEEYISSLQGERNPVDPPSPILDQYGKAVSAPPAPAVDPNVSAADYRDLRKRLDVNVDFNSEDGKIVNSALKSGRTTMKNELLAKAAESGDQGYMDAMKSWSDKLDKLDQLKSVLGKSATTRDKRVESFISNLFGKNSTYKQQLMNDLDGVFNSDIVGRAKAANMAQSLGEDGTPAMMPRQVTGAALKAGLLSHFAPGIGTIAAASTASPRLAASVTLPLLTRLEEGLKAAGVALTPRAASAMEALKRPANAMQQARIAAILGAELEAQMPSNVVPFRKVADEEDPYPSMAQR